MTVVHERKARSGASIVRRGVFVATLTVDLEKHTFEFPPPAHLMWISVHAGEVFASQQKALHWLQSPNPSLEGKTPLEAARTDAGYQQVDQILRRIGHGVLG